MAKAVKRKARSGSGPSPVAQMLMLAVEMLGKLVTTLIGIIKMVFGMAVAATKKGKPKDKKSDKRKQPKYSDSDSSDTNSNTFSEDHRSDSIREIEEVTAFSTKARNMFNKRGTMFGDAMETLFDVVNNYTSSGLDGTNSVKSGIKKKRIVSATVTLPSDSRQSVNVMYDCEKLVYKNLPPDWLDNNTDVLKQFGVPILSVPRISVPNYKARLPAVLNRLHMEMKKHDALKKEGIFRVPASKRVQMEYKEQIDNGAFIGCEAEDVTCMAELIKEWFRLLPDPLLSKLSSADILRVTKSPTNPVQIVKLFRTLEEPNYSTFLWFLDLLISVNQLEEYNKMTFKALSIVVAPELYFLADADPMEMMKLMQHVVNLIHLALDQRKAGNL